jgi:hypothetical protein
MKKPKGILPPLKSVFPEQPLSRRISLLLERTGLGISSQTIVEMAVIIQKDLLQGFKLLVDIDKQIGGVGLYNVNKQEGDGVTGVYRIEFRGIFRPLQYIYADLADRDLVWTARHIVQNSCLHVEQAFKYRFNINPCARGSLGVLLYKKTAAQSTLDTPFFQILSDLNETIYGRNKHAIEHIKIDSHDYTPADAIAVYLISRWAGVKLLEPTGLFNDWEGD